MKFYGNVNEIVLVIGSMGVKFLIMSLIFNLFGN